MGWFWIVVCILGWGGWALTQKMAGDHLSPMAIIFVGLMTYTALVPAVYAVMRQTSSEPLVWSTTGALRSAAGAVLSTVACVAFLFALKDNPVHMVTGITATYPVITLLLAWMFLREQIHGMKLLGICVIIAGTVLLEC